MTSMQSRFLRFHEAIKLKNTDENATLREKRDAVLERMRHQGLTFDWFNQGSYAMGTGVEPVQDDFDIDVGIVFSGIPRPIDPLALKGTVFKAVSGHTTSVEWRRHCIRVQYVRAGEPTYHVDLPVYWKDRSTGQLWLAVGKQHSGPGHKSWEHSDPRGLIDRVKSRFQGEDQKQFRRIVRYLKRWKDLHFPIHGHASPVGIGITVAALESFRPARATWSVATESGYDDLKATLDFVDRMRDRFFPSCHGGEFAHRISAELPVQPRSDAFARMTNQQMREFKQRLDTLYELLDQACRTETTEPLQRAFGTAFPMS